jgi:hypothetical protein
MRLRFAAAAGAALFFCALPALANGRFPASNQFLFSPVNPDYILLRTTYGLLPSTDNGASWAYVCEDVMGLLSVNGSGYEDPSIGLMANGDIVAADSRGINVSTDNGCNWSCQGGMLAHQTVVDLAVFPSDPSKAVAMVSTVAPNDASDTSSFYTQVFLTTDNGMTWNPVGPTLDPTVTVQTLDVPKSDPTRIYVSGTRAFGSNKTAWLFMYSSPNSGGGGGDGGDGDGGGGDDSGDGGDGGGGGDEPTAGGVWTEQPITEFDPTLENAIYIAAIDPNNADLVYLRTQGQATGGESRLYVTQNASAADGGATFTTPAGGTFQTPEASGSTIVGELLGFALSPDGSKVYLGTYESGVWMASTSDFVFEQMNANVDIQCLATRGSELWACGPAKTGFVAGVSTDDGTTFTSKLCSITGLSGVLSCPNTDAGTIGCGASGNTAAVCPATYDTLCSIDSIGGSCGPCDDAGVQESPAPPEAGVDAGPSTTPSKSSSSSSCGCSAVGNAGGTAGALASLLFTGLALSRRGARRARRGPAR